MTLNSVYPNSFYPVICTDNIETAKAFYTEVLEFETTFEADWYISLRSADYELALLDHTHESLPAPYRKKIQGLLLNLEVEDVDKVYEIMKSKGLTMALDLRSEEWGQRHFIIQGPDDVLIDVIQEIEPGESYAGDFTDGISS